MSIAGAQFKHLLFHGILLQKSVKLQIVQFDSKISIGLLMDNLYSPWDTILGTYMLSKIWQCALCARWNILHFEINAIVYPALVNLNPLETIFILRKGVVLAFFNHPPHYVSLFSVHKVNENCHFLTPAPLCPYQSILEYPNKILNTSIGNILKYHYQYGYSNNTGLVSVFFKDT